MENMRRKNKQKHIRIDLHMSPKIVLAIETECSRLHDLLVELKNQGLRPITHPFHERDVTDLALVVGLEAIQKMSYEQFEIELRRLTNRRPL